MSLIDLQTRANLVTLYGEPHRYYHNLNHIYDCLTKLEEYSSSFKLDQKQYERIEAALWFHDAVYNPKSKCNEYNSAELAINCSLDQEIIYCVLATQHHNPKSFTEEIVCDIDLSVLGGSEKDYNEYYNNIRKEYNFIPTNIYTENRIIILNSFLQKERMFHTDYFHRLYEEQARKNIELELTIIS